MFQKLFAHRACQCRSLCICFPQLVLALDLHSSLTGSHDLIGLLLLLVGPGLEEKYGSRNLLATIAVTAFATGLVQFLLFPHSALLGASGVVFMMIVLSSFTEMKKGGIPLTMLLVVALYLGSEIADGLTRTDNVSHLTHIVGGVCGIFFGFRLARAKKR